MDDKNSMQLFENKKIRTTWDEEPEVKRRAMRGGRLKSAQASRSLRKKTLWTLQS